ncbi:hypothetical protein SKAU_G00046850 [Synaphobranchus kaupii]|uniref:Uncharacterized protein n=1 Tax=Synaphobranchus kaupii TaxID=118154 RepID=A0A9Q1G3J6_SYNKA|nr:hypothetical protein SKAU_G00046850 [Synaphobranchus kaupii]
MCTAPPDTQGHSRAQRDLAAGTRSSETLSGERQRKMVCGFRAYSASGSPFVPVGDGASSGTGNRTLCRRSQLPRSPRDQGASGGFLLLKLAPDWCDLSPRAQTFERAGWQWRGTSDTGRAQGELLRAAGPE